jgi:hypothetical protein
MISEEVYSQSVPDFQIRDAVQMCVQRIEKRLKHSVMVSKSGSAVDRAAAIDFMKKFLTELESDINELVEDKIFEFTNSV